MAVRYKSHHYGATRVSECLNPTNGIRGRMEKRGLKPRDHARDNIVALREKQKENREKRHEQAPKMEEWKMQQFKNIKSKIRLEMENRARSPRSPEASASEAKAPTKSFLRKGSLEARQSEIRRAKQADPVLTPRSRGERKKESVPRAHDVNRLARRSQKDFVHSNRVEAKRLEPSRTDEADEVHRHSDFGTVPRYIQERKEQWAIEEERRKAAQPDPDCPPGMSRMPEAERLETLRILQESEEEATRLLYKLPLHSSTPSVVRKKEALEAKLKEIESAKAIFSKKVVYVRDD